MFHQQYRIGVINITDAGKQNLTSKNRVAFQATHSQLWFAHLQLLHAEWEATAEGWAPHWSADPENLDIRRRFENFREHLRK